MERCQNQSPRPFNAVVPPLQFKTIAIMQATTDLSTLLYYQTEPYPREEGTTNPINN